MSQRDDQFRDFVAQRSADLLRLAYLLCGDRVGAEDLVQSALLRAYSRWARISHPEQYVRRVLVTVAADEGRRAFRRREQACADPPESPDTRDSFSQSDDRDRLRTALQALPAGQRAAVVLRHWLDLDPTAAAVLLGCSPETVRSQSARGLNKLRAVYDVPASAARRNHE
ncbi:MAG: SigE family RNA polymerase sigma factor [Pseudonocardiales bacterium]|nr:MAG: SigE family RNA polymerase sigma factor [Pseudonocardiales bacterium]